MSSEALLDKETESAETWVDDHGDYLYRVALARVRNPEAAEDLVQETLVAAIKSVGGYHGASALRSWLTGILKHKIGDYFRERKRVVLAGDLTAESDEQSEDDFFDRHTGLWRAAPKEWNQTPADAVHNTDFQRILGECLSKLPDAMARLFVLRDVDEVEAEEVCRQLDISPSNLYTMLHRARLRLRRCLEIHWFGKAGSP